MNDFLKESKMNNNKKQTKIQDVFPTNILMSPIWVAWGATGRNEKGKVNKTLVNAGGHLGFASGWQNEDCYSFGEACERLDDAWGDNWIAGGVGIHNVVRAEIVCIDVDNISRDVALRLRATTGGVLEVSPSGNGYHIWGAGSVDRNYSYKTLVDGIVVGVEIIGTKGKWCTLTGDIITGAWSQLQLPEAVNGDSRGVGVNAPVGALREAFLSSRQGTRHEALYSYCRGLQASLVALGDADESIYYSVVEKTVKAHAEYVVDGESWTWKDCARSVWRSSPHDGTVIAHVMHQSEAQALEAFPVMSVEEVKELVKDYVPTQQKQVSDFVRAEPVEYWKLIEEEYRPVRVVRDIFLEQVAFQRQDGRWVWVDSREVKAVMKSKIRKMKKDERQARGFVVDGADDFLVWWAKDFEAKGLRANIADWDGRDRLKELADALNPVDPRLTPACVEYFVKDWAVKAWGKIYNSQVQNRMILLQGSQGIGKDSWAIALAGGFGAHFGVPALMSAKYLNEQQLARVVADKAVCLFDEFDKLAGAEALIKALITKRHFDIEVKFENNPARVEHRCSYIGTTNSSVFSDTTGNRRFLFFELAGAADEAIKFCFPSPDSDAMEAYQAQVLAQGYYLYQTQGTSYNEEFETIMKAIQAEVTPEDAGSEIVESFDELVARKIRENASFNQPWKRFFSASELREVFASLAKDYKVTISQVKTTVKKHGRYGRIGAGQSGQDGQARVYSLKEYFNDRQIIEQYFNKDDCPF